MRARQRDNHHTDWDEGIRLDKKSLQFISGGKADFPGLAVVCVAFANAVGGDIRIGVEDDASTPPPGQRIEPALVERVRKRIGELTVNVQVLPEVARAPNGAEYLNVHVARSSSVASTSDGRYYIRIGDECRPVVGDDVLRLLDERAGMPWESMAARGAARSAADNRKIRSFVAALRRSPRVKASVKEKSPEELLGHYGLTTQGHLTNLGVLMIGSRVQRARLGSAPVIQFIKYDERGAKTNKLVWDDHTLSPSELLDAAWQQIPDFRETYEVPEGRQRTTIPAFEEPVVRELLVNALVHRPYTQRGDIFLNLYPDRLEVVNPGRLPLGVTPRNILSASRRRNDALARVFHDLGLMEREGSGFDLLYDHLLASGRPTPSAREGIDSVHVTVPRRVVRPDIMRLLRQANERFDLTQRERIALGVLAQDEGLTAEEFADRLGATDTATLRSWSERLLELGLVVIAGRARATRYFVPPALLRSAGVDIRTTLKRVQPHRLRALILEDLERFPESSSADINGRVGVEIAQRTIKRALDALIDEGLVAYSGERRWRRYRLRPSASKRQSNDHVR